MSLPTVVQSLLPNCIISFLEKTGFSTTDQAADVNSFLSDAAFYDLLEYFVFVGIQVISVKEQYQKSLTDSKEQPAHEMSEIVGPLEKIKSFIHDLIIRVKTSPVEVETSLPRFVRVAKKLELSEKEFIALAYLFAIQAGALWPSAMSRMSLDLCDMTKLCEMTTKEMFTFIGQERKHVEQGILTLDTSYNDLFSSFSAKLPKECIYALIGSKITSEQFLKFDNTVMSETLLEEPDFFLPGIKDPEGTVKEENEEKEEVEQNTDATEETEEKKDEEFDLYEYMKEDREKSANTESSAKDNEDTDEFLAPYKNNIDYLDDKFQYLAAKIRMRNVESEKRSDEIESSSNSRSKDRSHDSVLREIQAKCRILAAKCDKRLKATTSFVPRLERIAQLRGLSDFEKWVLIFSIGATLSHDIMAAKEAGRFGYSLTVGVVLQILCENLEERISHRSFFYKRSKLIQDGMIKISDNLGDDLMETTVDIDRRMLDYLCGLDSEFSEMVEGSHLYFPQVKLENVILPENTKQLIVDSVSNFDKFKKARKQLGFEETISYGNSIVLLFFGESGTGKTMMANALANHIGKKVLLINFGNMMNAGSVLKYVFREAKINDALIFFDECESFFETRDNYGSQVHELLTEIEKFDGLIVMATNRQYELDEAMFRRITLAVEFKSPDSMLREQIWKKHIPSHLNLGPVDFEALSLEFELTGGLIKNAIINALSFAVMRDATNPIITEDDIRRACRTLLKAVLNMNDFDRKIIPKRGLNDLVLSPSTKEKVQQVIAFEKSRKILFNQWGFDSYSTKKQGTSCLIFGQAGTGKSLTAEVIGFELGLPLKVLDVNELLNKYTFNTTKNIETLFKECKESGALLVLEMTIEETGNLSQSVLILLTHIEHYDGPVIMIASNINTLDPYLMRRFKFVLDLGVPSVTERKQLWRKLIPQKVPHSITEVEFDGLASDYHEFTGGNIENVAFRACSKAACSENKQLTLKLLKDSADEELKNNGVFMTQDQRNSVYH